jgi:hypothetical protein
VCEVRLCCAVLSAVLDGCRLQMGVGDVLCVPVLCAAVVSAGVVCSVLCAVLCATL